MKHYKEIKIPAKTEMHIYKTTCDMCGRDIKRDAYDAEEVEIKHRTGEVYPEGGSGEVTSIDMCGECFEKKLVPWLKSNGVEIRTKEWSW